MDTFGTDKQKVGLMELEIVIGRLELLKRLAEEALGKSAPIISENEIALIKDHLDLVVKYTRI